MSATVATTGVTVYECGPGEASLFRELSRRLGVMPTITAETVSADSIHLASGHRAISVSHRTRISAATVLGLHRRGVRYISTRSVGVDHIDVTSAARLGITVENVPYSPDGVADFTILLILAALRQTNAVLRRVDVGDLRVVGGPGRELRELTVGVVGAGRIGSAVVGRLRGFGCAVIIHDAGDPSSIALDELLARSDVVTLHVPLTEGTRHLLDRDRIARMRPGAVVVNTARGALIDTGALADALESGRLAGAALDVLEGEDGIFSVDWRGADPPHRALARLRAHPGVTLTPHVAYYTDRALREVVETSLRNILAFANGRRRG